MPSARQPARREPRRFARRSLSCVSDEEILGLVEGRLAPEVRARIEAHLDSCDQCRALVADNARVMGAATSDATSLRSVPVLPAAGPSAALVARGGTVDRYVILDLLGRGGMGVVYRAYDPELDRKVALKLVRAESRNAAALRQRLVREAQVMARVSHPNVLTVYDAGLYDEQVFIAMELVDGGTLCDWRRAATRSWREVLGRFVLAGRGLAAAHAVGLVHRDFKPDNVLIGQDGRVRVADFGLALPTSQSDPGEPLSPPAQDLVRLTHSGARLGTPGYMSPEQLRSEDVDARTDVFSFCVALYEALFGVRPFAGDSADSLLSAIEAGQLRTPASNEAPRWLRAAVERGLASQPDARYPSMDLLLTALHADPAPLRRRWLLSAAGLAVVCVAGLTYRHSQHSEHMCRDGAAQLAGIWDTSRKQLLERAFAASGLPFAADANRTVAATLDRYGAAWAAMHDDACAATRFRGEQSEELLDLRIQCLADRRSELTALTQALVAPSKRELERSVEASAALSAIVECAATHELVNRVPLPKDPAKRRAVAAASARVAAANAMTQLGRNAEALALLDLADADAEAWPPLAAERQYLLAAIAAIDGKPQKSEALGYASLMAAERGRDDDKVSRAWTLLGYVVGRDLGRADEGLRLLGLARASAERTSDPQHYLNLETAREAEVLLSVGRFKEALEPLERQLALERAAHLDEVRIAKILASYGNALALNGREEEAERTHDEALAIMAKNFGADHPLTCTSAVNLALDRVNLGRPREALPLLDRVLRARERQLRPGHPALASVLTNRAAALNALERYSEGLADAERAIGIFGTALSPGHPALIEPLDHAATAQLELGRPRLAQPLAERALVLCTGQKVDPVDDAFTRFLVARSLIEGGGDRRRAVTLFAEARAALDKLARELGGHYRAKLTRVDDWRKKHPL
ncbi:MAG: hypothetical protein JWM53_3934 [bacterium]|nr:hypothetical protein [bacterium]